MTESRPASADSPIRVAVVNDYEIVVRGLAGMLAPYADRLHVVELAAGTGITGPVDVALFDTYGRPGLGLVTLAELVADANIRHVAVFTVAASIPLAQRVVELGATGFLPKSLTAPELVDGLERVGRGETVVWSERPRRSGRQTAGSWPGQARGLTGRESELLSLVALGLHNNEIGQALFVTSNTVKSHLKNVFRKLGVRNRAEAIAAVAGDAGFQRHTGQGAGDGPAESAPKDPDPDDPDQVSELPG